MLTEMPLLQVVDTIGTRLVVFIACSILGSVLICLGRLNIKTEIASETGRRRLVNQALGRSNNYEGSKAVLVGWIRIICGAGLIIFGIFFVFVGPLLANGRAAPNFETIGFWLSVAGGVVLAICIPIAFSRWRNQRETNKGVACGECGRLNAVTTKVCPRCMTKTH